MCGYFLTDPNYFAPSSSGQTAKPLSDAILKGLSDVVPDRVFRATTVATTRLVTSSVTHAVALGVLQSVLDRSLASLGCESCEAAGRDCHACAATQAWFRAAADAATLHADEYGAFYGEYWAQVFLDGGAAGVEMHSPLGTGTSESK